MALLPIFARYSVRPILKRNLRVFIEAAKARSDALDHVLFHGSPGLGKTSLAHIIAHELGVGIQSTSGPVIERAGDLAAVPVFDRVPSPTVRRRVILRSPHSEFSALYVLIVE